jgi:hypothetical protein
MPPPTGQLPRSWQDQNTLIVIRVGYIKRTMRPAMLLLAVSTIAIWRNQPTAAWDALYLSWGLMALCFTALARNQVTARRIDRSLTRWTDER